jgi:CRISPR-associated protein Csd2
MAQLKNKIDFVAIISVDNANANGDPLNGNRPRTDYEGLGEISDVCIKRKIRNRMQDILSSPGSVFVQSQDKCDDGAKSLSDRAKELNTIKDPDEYAQKACEKWIDVRTFGQVFAFKGSSLSVGVRGPVSIHQAVSIDPIEINSMQITKSVNSETKDGKSSDTMGTKHFVKFGLYEVKGSINVQLAEKTGFSEEDAELLKNCLKTLFVNDSSSARPDGSMEVIKLYWFKHNCKDGQYSSAKVHRSVRVRLKDGVKYPKCADDYEISLDKLDGLEVEEIEGI